MKKPVISTLLFLLFSYQILASEKLLSLNTVYAPFQKILETHLVEKKTESGGLVSAFDYQAALSDEKVSAKLEEQKKLLKVFDYNKIESGAYANAFWTNAYNFFMIEYILNNTKDGEIVESVRDYGSFFNPYRVFRKEVLNVGGTEFSLDGIEKGILLSDEYKEKGWFEARTHFMVNCASVGCPPLRKTVYTQENVESFLTENTKLALSTKRHLYTENNILYLTSLFKWYNDDYEYEEGSVKNFILKYIDEQLKDSVEKTSRVRYIGYDWSLNKPSNFEELK